MPANTASQDVRTLGVVLRRTNYGEADRILNIITPGGKVSAIAKGVRKSKSKLAGGVEMFCLSELVVHFGRGKMGTVTGAKMVRYYSGVLRDFERMELAGMVLKKVGRAAEHTDSPEWFNVTRQVLEGLDEGMDVRVVEAWFLLNLLRVSGEEVNLYRDVTGEKLRVDGRYDWEVAEDAFVENGQGRYGADEIKVMRLMSTGVELKMMQRIKVNVDLWGRVLDLVKVVAE